jgi:hypothetical protein
VDGVIISTIDDYRHVYSAFGEGLAVVHGKADDKLIATVTAIEAIAVAQKSKGGDSSIIKVTLRDLAKRLRVGSLATASQRLGAALDYGAIEQVEELTGRGGARHFELLMTAKEIQEEPDLGVFPPPGYVEKFYVPRSQAKTGEQTAQNGETVYF